MRGLHTQTRKPQGKLLRVVRGEIFDVAVDINPQSETFGQWVGVTLSEENKKLFYIPPGYAHGFQVVSDVCDVLYKCTDYYAPDCDGAVAWDSCGIDWGFESQPVLSDKDAAAPPLAAFDSPFVWEG